jgi:hypothetical protein
VPTDGSKGKINGVAVAFGVIFGLAFLSVIGYLVFSHRRRQKRKADTLHLIKMQQKKKEEDKQEKERQQRLEQQQDVPLPPIPPPENAYSDNRHHHQGHGYNYGYENNGSSNVFYPPQMPSAPSTPHYQARDPFQDPNYLHREHSQPQIGSNPYYAQAGTVAIGGHGPDPFDRPGPPPQLMASSQPPNDSMSFVPEEMGYTSPTMHDQYFRPESTSRNFKVPVDELGPGGRGRLATGARDKFSFIEPGSSYR